MRVEFVSAGSLDHQQIQRSN